VCQIAKNCSVNGTECVDGLAVVSFWDLSSSLSESTKVNLVVITSLIFLATTYTDLIHPRE
jgi:hypothetical protein